MGMIRLIAPEGYKLRDKRNGNVYSEVLTAPENKRHFELVPDTTEPTTTNEVYGG